MRAKDSLRLEALRAIKSAVMLEQTSSAAGTTLSRRARNKISAKAGQATQRQCADF